MQIESAAIVRHLIPDIIDQSFSFNVSWILHGPQPQCQAAHSLP